MKCHIFLLLSFVGSDWIFVSGSIVKINDTTLASLPPLFSLEAWSRCQLPGDVYCMVDAELVSESPSPVLQLLQEYSEQTLKHYNRSQIHRGVCVTRCSASRDQGRLPGELGGLPGELAGSSWAPSIGSCINESIAEYGLQATVLSVGWCSAVGEHAATGGARALGGLLLALIVLASLATSLHIIGDRCAKDNGITSNKYLLAFSIKRNWEILTYDRSKPRQDDRMKDLACLEGIRVLAIQCVIFSHVLFIYIYSYTDNPQYVEKMYDQFGWQGVLNSPLWLQAFFSISAFLTTYSLLICNEKKPYTVVKCLVAIATRWVRLTPAAVFALWFTIHWFPALGAGPQWGWLVQREAHDCSERWWHHVLYTHNHLPLGKFCMGHTWYLAVDMQLHILGVLLLLVCLRWRRAVWPILAGLMMSTILLAGFVTYLYDLDPIITAQAPESLRSLFAGSTLMSQLYLPSYMNLAGYVCGMAVAFILHDNQRNGVMLADNKLFSLIFHLSLTVGSICVLTGSVFLSDARAPLWSRVSYAASDRAVCAVTFSLFMLGCVSRCRSALVSVFSWRGFHTLGRLSYCAFLIHFIVLRLTLAADSRLNHVSVLACLTLFITSSILTYVAAVPVCLFIELPFTQLWKALIEDERPASEIPVSSPVSPQDAVKPFDLVANVNRGHVMRVE